MHDKTNRPAGAAGPHADLPGAGLPSRERVRQCVHDLRNGMNTLMMNAAVLGARAQDVPESLRPFVERIGTSGKQCSEELAKLFAFVESLQR